MPEECTWMSYQVSVCLVALFLTFVGLVLRHKAQTPFMRVVDALLLVAACCVLVPAVALSLRLGVELFARVAWGEP